MPVAIATLRIDLQQVSPASATGRRNCRYLGLVVPRHHGSIGAALLVPACISGDVADTGGRPVPALLTAQGCSAARRGTARAAQRFDTDHLRRRHEEVTSRTHAPVTVRALFSRLACVRFKTSSLHGCSMHAGAQSIMNLSLGTGVW